MMKSLSGALKLRSCEFEWGLKTYIMGIVNVTPDSFSGDGILDHDRAYEFALSQARLGADILDVGGESTRPGFKPVAAEEEQARVLPLIRRIRKNSDVVISIDTTKSDVLQKALDNGADMLNSVAGIEDDAVLGLVIDRQIPVVIMHGYSAPLSSNCVDSVVSYLDRSARRVASRGLNPSSIILDPGIGFGKTPEQNIELLSSLSRIKALGFPILIGTSRKSTIGLLVGKSANDRTFGTAATVALAITYGADVVRVHDVTEMCDVVKVTDAVCRGWRPDGWKGD
jgi:dihydropteroate synthase